MARVDTFRHGTEIGGNFPSLSEVAGKKGEVADLSVKKIKKRRIENSFLARLAVWIVNHFFPFWQTFSLTTKVTFGLTDRAGNVGHDKIASLFGTVREKYGLTHIPGFEKCAGKTFLLKTGAARIKHYGEFCLGDDIITKINVVDVGASMFKLLGRFICKKTGRLCATALHEIAYTKPNGRPTAINPTFKFLLTLAKRRDLGDFSGDLEIDLSGKPEISRRQLAATSDMINMEQNVSHDVFVALMAETIEIFLLSLLDRSDCAYKVAVGSYKYGIDFYFGDEIIIKLLIVNSDDKAVEFGAEFCDQEGKLHTVGTQKIVFTDNSGAPKRVPEKLAAAINSA